MLLCCGAPIWMKILKPIVAPQLQYRGFALGVPLPDLHLRHRPSHGYLCRDAVRGFRAINHKKNYARASSLARYSRQFRRAAPATKSDNLERLMATSLASLHTGGSILTAPSDSLNLAALPLPRRRSPYPIEICWRRIRFSFPATRKGMRMRRCRPIFANCYCPPLDLPKQYSN